MLKNSLTNIGEALSKQQFVQLDELLLPETCQLLSKRIHILQTAGKLKKCDQCPSSQWVYEDACYAEVHKLLSEQLSKLLGIELIATFNAVRLYSHRANLPKHRDREACEFSLSVPIDYAGDEQWPLCLADKQEDELGHAVSLAIGDGVMLQGAKVYHWRRPLKNQWQIQAFFFFVDAAGEFKDYAGDIIDKYPKQEESKSSES
jgi:hypothetical protein